MSTRANCRALHKKPFRWDFYIRFFSLRHVSTHVALGEPKIIRTAGCFCSFSGLKSQVCVCKIFIMWIRQLWCRLALATKQSCLFCWKPSMVLVRDDVTSITENSESPQHEKWPPPLLLFSSTIPKTTHSMPNLTLNILSDKIMHSSGQAVSSNHAKLIWKKAMYGDPGADPCFFPSFHEQ